MSYDSFRKIIEDALANVSDQIHGGEVDVELDVDGCKSLHPNATYLTVEKGVDKIDLVMFPTKSDEISELWSPRANIYSQMNSLAFALCTLNPDAEDHEDRDLSARIDDIIERFTDLAEQLRATIVS